MYISEKSNVMIQGITGRQGAFHTKLMLDYGTKIVAGTTPGKGGQEFYGVPVYDAADEVVKAHDVDASIIFVPARFT